MTPLQGSDVSPPTTTSTPGSSECSPSLVARRVPPVPAAAGESGRSSCRPLLGRPDSIASYDRRPGAGTEPAVEGAT